MLTLGEIILTSDEGEPMLRFYPHDAQGELLAPGLWRIVGNDGQETTVAVEHMPEEMQDLVHAGGEWWKLLNGVGVKK